MSESLGLGKIITTEQHRDAVHIAVAPVIAGSEGLFPGRHIGILEGDIVGIIENAIGIVDPFLPYSPQKGQRFWMYLYPGSITSLRHEWTHPALPLPTLSQVVASECRYAGDKAASEQWLRDFVYRTDCPSYEAILAGLIGASSPTNSDDYSVHLDGDYIHVYGTDAHGEIPPEFWDHIEIVTGRKFPPKERATYFSCSC